MLKNEERMLLQHVEFPMQDRRGKFHLQIGQAIGFVLTEGHVADAL